MSEFWVSEGRTWCKYCKKYISSNKIQIRQHEAGQKHINAEEEFVRSLSSKVKPAATAASAASSRIERDTGELLERIARLHQEVQSKSKRGDVVHQPEILGSPLDHAKVPEPDEQAYPAPAHEALGPWIEVTKDEAVTLVSNSQAPESSAAEVQSGASVLEELPVLRVGAVDAADEEEAVARDEAARCGTLGVDDVSDAWDAFDSRKRTIRKPRKRKRRL